MMRTILILFSLQFTLTINGYAQKKDSPRLEEMRKMKNYPERVIRQKIGDTIKCDQALNYTLKFTDISSLAEPKSNKRFLRYQNGLVINRNYTGNSEFGKKSRIIEKDNRTKGIQKLTYRVKDIFGKEHTEKISLQEDAESVTLRTIYGAPSDRPSDSDGEILVLRKLGNNTCQISAVKRIEKNAKGEELEITVVDGQMCIDNKTDKKIDLNTYCNINGINSANEVLGRPIQKGSAR